jgi:iron complex transport system ATP-binding protein
MTRLELENISLNYGHRRVLAEISARFEAGNVVALVGPNGAGKSSLLRVCAGLIEPAAGMVRVEGRSTSELGDRERARKLAYLPPDGRSAWPLSARRIVALGRAPYLKPLRGLSPADEAAIDRALARAEVSHLADRSFDTLSSGERGRVLIARALATCADILVLDEPVAALDPKHQLTMMEIARDEAQRGGLVIMAIHALELTAEYADHVLLLESGRTVAEGTPADVLSERNVRNVFGVATPGGVQPTRMRRVGKGQDCEDT